MSVPGNILSPGSSRRDDHGDRDHSGPHLGLLDQLVFRGAGRLEFSGLADPRRIVRRYRLDGHLALPSLAL